MQDGKSQYPISDKFSRLFTKWVFIYDSSNKIFVENPAERKSRNWGFLKQNIEYTMAFLRIDIVGNTEIVRNNSQGCIESAYEVMRDIFVNSIESRNGRVWSWDGDGGLAAFCFGNMNESATLSAIEILHELFLFNHTSCPLPNGIQVRIAAHSGSFEYTSDNEEMMNSDTVKAVGYIEHNHTQTNCITISHAVMVMLETLTAKQFMEFKSTDRRNYYEYSIRLLCDE